MGHICGAGAWREPRRMFSNASGLTWIGPPKVLFSEIKSGAHMAIVTAAENRTEGRDVYVLPHERGMGHRSYLSPDGNSVLVVEMDNDGWLPCRVVPFDGSSQGRQVGPPKGSCTHAAWSPDPETQPRASERPERWAGPLREWRRAGR